MIKSWVESSKKWATQYGQIIVWVTLTFFAFDLLYWRIIRGYTPPVSYVPWPPAPDWVETLYAGRWALRVLEAAGGVTLLFLEVIDQSLSRWLRATLESRARLFVLIGVSAFLLGSYLIQPGNSGAGDATAHIATPWVIRESIKEGQWFASWSNYGYFGHPFLQFYSFAYYYSVVLVSFVFSNFYDANKVTLLLWHILSAYPLYLYTRQITNSRIAGVVGSLAWSATFYRYHIIVIMGKFSIAPFVALIPLQLYLIECLVTTDEKRRRRWGALALTIGVMIWTHKLYSSWAIGFGFIYVLTRLLFPFQALQVKQSLLRFVLALSAHVIGIIAALYEIIPSFAEQSFVILGTLLSTKRFGLPAPQLQNVVIFKESYLTDWFGGYVGNVILALAIITLVIVLVTLSSRYVAIVVQFALAMFMTFAPAYIPDIFNAIFQSLPLGQLAYASGLSSGIYLMMVIAPASALVGVFVVFAIERSQSISQYIGTAFIAERFGIFITLILFAELIPTSLWINLKYPDEYIGDRLGRRPLLAYLAQTSNKTARIVDVKGHYNNLFLLSMLSGYPTLLGQLPDSTPQAHSLASNISYALEQDSLLKHLNLDTLNQLHLLDIGYVITDSSVTQFDGLERVMQTDGAILWSVPSHSPSLLSSRLLKTKISLFLILTRIAKPRF